MASLRWVIRINEHPIIETDRMRVHAAVYGKYLLILECLILDELL